MDGDHGQVELPDESGVGSVSGLGVGRKGRQAWHRLDLRASIGRTVREVVAPSVTFRGEPLRDVKLGGMALGPGEPRSAKGPSGEKVSEDLPQISIGPQATPFSRVRVQHQNPSVLDDRAGVGGNVHRERS